MKFTTLVLSSARRWIGHDGPGLAAAVSFYAIFAMAPLLVFAVVTAAKALGPEKAKAAAVGWLSDMVPLDTAESLVSIVHVKFLAEGPWWSNVISALVFVWAASLIFVRLVYGTRIMFGERGSKHRSFLRKSLISRVIGVTFAIAAGLVICSVFVFSSLATPLSKELQVGTRNLIGVANSLILAVGGVILLGVVPFHRPGKKTLMKVAMFFLFVFFVGRGLFQSYITYSPIASAYGVASSVVVFLVWIYYLSCAYFIGAALCAELSLERRYEGEL